MNLTEKKLKSTRIFKGALLDVWKDEVQLSNGRITGREYIKHPGAVVMIPVLPDRKLALIRQYRYPMGKEFIELPAGKLDEGEDRVTSAKRELEEEIGFVTNQLTELTEIHPCIGYSDERMWLFLADQLTLTQQNTDHDEFIELIPTRLTDAVKMVWRGEISDVKTIIGILWANSHLQHLFQ